jgi:lactate dehydrogenase-like 2-hydroxyacid dehydrogenase
MTKPILLVTRKLPADVEARAQAGFEARLNADDAKVGTDALVARAQGAAAILCCPADKLDAAAIDALPDSVRVIGTFSVGFDHIDMAAARRRGIPVVNTPDVLSVATAECAMLLIMAAARRAGEGERMVRAGAWTGWTPTQMLGRQVSGRSLGIFGMGRIGRELARMAQGFGMPVHYLNRSRLPAELEHGATYHADETAFLAASEVLSLHAPGGDATRHWLNQARLAMLPRGAIVVNTSRGTLIDDSALLDALENGQVRAAGLDVYAREPEVDARYLNRDDVVLLPHLGSATDETRSAMGHLALDGIEAVLAGRSPDNLVR